MRRLFLLAVPAAAGVILVFHPPDPAPGRVVAELGDVTTRWLAVHVALLLALPLLGLWLWVSLAGIESTAASVARASAVVFAALYSAFDALVGIGTGILVREAISLDGGSASALAERWWEIPAPMWVFSTLGPLSWLLAASATGLAHLRAGSGWVVAGGIVVAGPLFGFGHPIIAGPIGMLALVVAATALARRG